MAHTRLGPVAVAIIGLSFIAVGTAVKTGYIQIRRGSPSADGNGAIVRTGAGDVEIPLPQRDSAAGPAVKAPPTPPGSSRPTPSWPRPRRMTRTPSGHWRPS